MNNAVQAASVATEGGNHPDEVSGMVGAAQLSEIETMSSLDELGRYLLEKSGLSLDQVQKMSAEFPPELIQTLKQPGQREKFKTIIENMALFLASETKKPGARMAYPLDKIFANGDPKLGNDERIAAATTDLLAGGLVHGLIDGAMSDEQQKRLLDVHGMYPEKGVFELNKDEKWGKYQALLADGVFDTQQAKLLLDRGYAGTLGKIFSGIGKIANYTTIAGFLLILFLFWKIDGCGIINGTVDLGKQAVKTTKEVAAPVVDAGVDVLKFFGGGLTYISEGLQSKAITLATLKAEQEAVEERLLEVKLRIKDINKNESVFKFWDSDEEDALQDEEEELSTRSAQIDKEIFQAEEALRAEEAAQKRFSAPFKSASDLFTEKRGDMKGRTEGQWKEFNKYMGGIGSGGSGKSAEEIQQEEAAKAKQKEAEDAAEILRKGRVDDW